VAEDVVLAVIVPRVPCGTKPEEMVPITAAVARNAEARGLQRIVLQVGFE
jgi:hypothetical protein